MFINKLFTFKIQLVIVLSFSPDYFASISVVLGCLGVVGWPWLTGKPPPGCLFTPLPAAWGDNWKAKARKKFVRWDKDSLTSEGGENPNPPATQRQSHTTFRRMPSQTLSKSYFSKKNFPCSIYFAEHDLVSHGVTNSTPARAATCGNRCPFRRGDLQGVCSRSPSWTLASHPARANPRAKMAWDLKMLINPYYSECKEQKKYRMSHQGVTW